MALRVSATSDDFDELLADDTSTPGLDVGRFHSERDRYFARTRRGGLPGEASKSLEGVFCCGATTDGIYGFAKSMQSHDDTLAVTILSIAIYAIYPWAIR